MAILGVPAPCLDCGKLSKGTRCEECRLERQRTRERGRQRGQRHYDNEYRKRAKIIRDTAEICWICGEGARENDGWTADHLHPGQKDSPLAPAHRSCNSRRGNTPLEHTRGRGHPQSGAKPH